MKILIDNGHGINTPGKRSPDGELLKGIYNREIARRITTKLQHQGIDAELLVPEDEDISLHDRCLRANKQSIINGKDNVLIISIHCNAASRDGKWHNARGWIIYSATQKVNPPFEIVLVLICPAKSYKPPNRKE